MSGPVKVMREGLLVGFVAKVRRPPRSAPQASLAPCAPLFTVNLLGLAVFNGVRDPSILQLPIPVDVMAVFWYNALHLVLSLGIGLIVVRLVAQAEARPSQARAMLFTIVGGFVVTILAVGILTEPMRALLPWWSIVVANVVAVWMAGSYLLRAHPGIWRRLVG